MQGKHLQPICIDLLRHGETLAGKCFLGSTDAVLSEAGWQQMNSAKLVDDYDAIISSPLQRCASFAHEFANKKNINLSVEPLLQEMDFGLWEGQTSAQLWESDNKALSDFWRDPVSNTPPQGEKLVQFQERVLKKFQQIQSAYTENKLLIVCHAGVIKIILCDILGISLESMQKLSIDHGSVSRIHIWPDTSQVIFINHVDHIDVNHAR